MGKQWKQCQIFLGGGSKITADGDCSHAIKRRLLLGRKVMTNLDRRSNQSILKEISPGISLEGMMLKLKLQYVGHLMRRVDPFEKTLTKWLDTRLNYLSWWHKTILNIYQKIFFKFLITYVSF